MQLIFGTQNAELLKDRYTVLELETIEVEDRRLIEVYCVIPAEKIAMQDIAQVDHHVKMHNEFVAALKRKEYKVCKDLYIHVIGKFGGEVDSFYDVIMQRIRDEQQAITS